MINTRSALLLFDSIQKFYEEELGIPLDILMMPVCFCQHARCQVADTSPITVPHAQTSSIQIHINSTIHPDWYPNQLLYQYSHELWHAYEFLLYGVDYPWDRFVKLTEPYAHAASLCVLHQKMIPESIIPTVSQQTYFDVTRVDEQIESIYVPGIKLAKEVDYSLKNLHLQYLEDVSRRIRGR